jgi:hypothetical protein
MYLKMKMESFLLLLFVFGDRVSHGAQAGLELMILLYAPPCSTENPQSFCILPERSRTDVSSDD